MSTLTSILSQSAGLLLIFFVSGSIPLVMAQHANLIVFSEDGHEFTLTVNGEKVNETPKTRVKKVGITSENNRIRIDFASSSIEGFSGNQYLELGYEHIFNLHEGRRGYRLRMVGQSDVPPIAAQPEPQTQQPVTERREATPRQTGGQEQGESNRRSSNILGVTISEGDGQMGISVSSDLVGTTTTTTTTTSASSSTQSSVRSDLQRIGARYADDVIHLETGDVYNFRYQREMFPYPHLEILAPEGGKAKIFYGENLTYESEIPFLWRDPKIDEYLTLRVEQGDTYWQVRFMPKKQHRTIIEIGSSAGQPVAQTSLCNSAMNLDQFNRSIESIKNQSFTEQQLQQAKNVARNNCLSVVQIATIMGLFSFEETMLQFAKFAYDHTFEKGNYYLLNDEFSFSASVSELASYINSK